MNIIQRIKRRILIWRVNRALHIRLTDWQIAKIFEDKPFPEDVRHSRRQGKTTAQILFVLLCPLLRGSPSQATRYGFPPKLYVDNVLNPGGYTDCYEAARVAFFFGEDGVNHQRRLLFMSKTLEINMLLREAGIKTHTVHFAYGGKTLRL